MFDAFSLTMFVLAAFAGGQFGAANDLEPFAPSGGAKFRPAKPSGFGRVGVDVQLPTINGTKELPFDLTNCSADNCLMCARHDKEACILCDEFSAYPWRSTDRVCVDACDSGDIKVKTANRGLWCVGCPGADERECNQYCAGYRWDSSSGNCTPACQLPVDFGRNTGAGTCTAGEELSGGGSCATECVNGASPSLPNSLTYACASDAQSMDLPAAVCETIWDQVTVDSVDLGEVYQDIHEAWSEVGCDTVSSRGVSVTSYSVVANALAALGLPNSSFFDLGCFDGAAFPKAPKFTLNSTESFELVADKVTIHAPTLYFSKPTGGSWSVVLHADSDFTLPDNGSSIVTGTMGVFSTGPGRWDLRTGTLATWKQPFEQAWLENHGIIAGYSAQGGVANSTLDMWSECSLVLDSVEDEGTFTYTYGAATDPNLVKVELHDASIHTVINLVEDFEELTISPLALRDFYLTEPLYVLASDTDGVYVDEAWGVVSEGLTFGTTLKIDSDSRLHSALRCIGASYKWFYLRFFTSDAADDTLEIVHTHAVDAFGAWEANNLTMNGVWDASNFALNVTADLHVGLSRGSYEFPVNMTYDGRSHPALSTQTPVVNNTLGFQGIVVEDVHGVFSWDSTAAVCSIFLTGDLTLSSVGSLPLRGVVHSSAPKHGFWAVTSATDDVNLGLDIVPWWNAAQPGLAIEDATKLEDFAMDDTTMTLASALSASVVFPTKDDGSATRTRVFERGWLLSGTHTHLDTEGIGVRMLYTATSASDDADFEVIFDSDRLDNIVDGRKSTYTGEAEGDFVIEGLSNATERNLSLALQIDPDAWDEVVFTPFVQTVDVPAFHLGTMSTASLADQVLLVDLAVVWAGTSHDFEVVVPFSDIAGDYITGFLRTLAFQCVTNDDCTDSGEVCWHSIHDGRLNATTGLQTWHCEPGCNGTHFSMYGDLGCFDVFAQSDECFDDLPCGDLYCILDECQPRYENGEACSADAPEYCFSGFCCEGCDNTCQEYPLEPGFNCSTRLEFDECASNWCSSEEGDDDLEAVCLALIKDGKTCDEDAHCESTYCSTVQSTTCVTQYNVSGPCYLDDDCADSLTCCWECGFECQEYPRGLGLSCLSDDDCDSDFCSTVSYTCSEPQDDGEACLADDGCVSGYCNSDRGECFTQLDDDETCSFDDDCTSGYCSPDRDTCFTLLDVDDSCEHDSDCGSGWCTQRGGVYSETTASGTTCQAKYDSGEQCSADDDCESGDCSVACSWFVCSCA